MSASEITRIEVTNTILTGNLGDMGLDADDCNRIADLTETAITERLTEEYPGIPIKIVSDVQFAGGVGGGVQVEMWVNDEEFGEMPGHQDEDGLRDTLQDVSNDVTENYSEFKDHAKNGLYTVDGKRYALTQDAQPTSRLFSDGHVNFNDVADGETYDEEWSAQAIDEIGNRFTVYWIFENTKGENGIESPENFPWDEADRVVEN